MNDDATNEPINKCTYCKCEVVGHNDPEQDIICDDCKESEIIILHHEDMDGFFAGGVVLDFYELKTPHRPNSYRVNYNDSWEDMKIKAKIKPFTTLYVLDFTFDGRMKEIQKEVDRLIWIDHHPKAIEQNDNKIEGIRDEEYCGAMLTWKYLFGEIEHSDYLEIVDDYDCWKHKNPNTIPIMNVLNINVKNPQDVVNEDYLYTNWLKSRDLDIGKYIEEYKSQERQWLIKGTRIIDFNDYFKVGILNAHSQKSLLGNEICKEYPDIDVAIIWSVVGDKIRYSFRSTKGRAREFAELYGGGGHINAAGLNVCLGEDQLLWRLIG